MLRSNFLICLILSLSSMTLGLSAKEAKQALQTVQPESDEEAFLIRRIAEFWKDGDFAIVKMQIVDFLDRYPKSSFADYFLGILGDIHLQENRHTDALEAYRSVTDPAIVEKTLLNKLHCYYELDRYQDLANDGLPYLSGKTIETEERQQEFDFLMGEAFFRQALELESGAEKTALARQARSRYESLPEGRYGEIAQFAIAEIHAILGEHEQGAIAYRKLAEKHSQMREDLLFQAASLQVRYDKETAIETFGKIKAMEGKRADEATFNLIVLLFRNEAYEELINSYGSFSEDISESYRPDLHFIFGKSYFCMGQYQNAISLLKKYIDSTYIPSDQLKNALLIQMTCARQIKDEPLFNRTFNLFESLFPGDREITKALFMHAMILKEQGAISKADEKLGMIKDKYGELDDQESFLFEYGLLAYQNERWLKAHELFRTYVTDFKEGNRLGIAWKLFLFSSINLYKHSGEESSYSKPEFFNDLKAIPPHSNCLNDDEMNDYALLYAKIAYELDHYSEALRFLQDHIFKVDGREKDSIALSEAHFIAGLSLAATGTDHSQLCVHLERALALNPDLYDSPSTHVQLYNAYISLAGYGETETIPADAAQQKEWTNRAAAHLEEAVSKGSVSIKEENRLWIADHYYQKIKDYYDRQWKGEEIPPPEVAAAIDRATSHYQSLLLSNGELIPITSENLHLEREAVKLAKLFSYQNVHQKKLDLLTQLLEQQTAKLELNWGFRKNAFFELAVVYDAMGDKEKAFETYRFIHASADRFPTVLANHATLETARLHFELLEEGLRRETNGEVVAILNDLKELQIRKNPTSEPTHLEAALEYVKIRSLISNREERDARHLFFLNRMKEDFTCQEDLVTRDYLAALDRDPSKKCIFDAYMKFIDAEKIRLEVQNLHRQERLGEIKQLYENGLTLYGEIESDPHTPHGLYKRVCVSMRAMNAFNVY
ncbi:MAG: hypothetical protein AAGE99_01070 [Chlamydiota bacterium]